jgi:hypothetical protein
MQCIETLKEANKHFCTICISRIPNNIHLHKPAARTSHRM